MTAVAEAPWHIRAAIPSDHQFVWETTLKVRRPHGVPWSDWVALHGTKVREEIALSLGLVMDGGGVLLGFMVVNPWGEAAALSMLYVKREFRGNGFGLQLLGKAWMPGDTIPVTAPTPSWKRWAELRRIKWLTVDDETKGRRP